MVTYSTKTEVFNFIDLRSLYHFLLEEWGYSVAEAETLIENQYECEHHEDKREAVTETINLIPDNSGSFKLEVSTVTSFYRN